MFHTENLGVVVEDVVECTHSTNRDIECVHSIKYGVECIHSMAIRRRMYTFYSTNCRKYTFYNSPIECIHSTSLAIECIHSMTFYILYNIYNRNVCPYICLSVRHVWERGVGEQWGGGFHRWNAWVKILFPSNAGSSS